MKQPSSTRPDAELEPVLPLDSTEEELDAKTDDDELYSDEFLDEFMNSDSSDDDDWGYAISSSSAIDADDDFDSYFRDAEGYSEARRQRRQRSRDRHARESFEFEPFDRSDWRAFNQRRPRR